MRYEPLREELSDAERAFLERLGIDWLATRAELCARWGKRRYRGTWDAVALPATTALSDEPLELFAQCFPDVMDLPPEYWFAEYFPHDDARANHAAIERQIAARLGAPENRDTSNCLARVWRIGVFRVEVHTFPPELQSFHSKNVLHEREPRLAIASSVSIHADFALVYPDASLAPGELLELPPMRLDTSRRWTRRNPRALASKISRTALVAWQDADRVALSSRETSLVLPRGPVVIERQVGGRGPSGSALYVGDVCVLRGDHLDALDPVGQTLSRFWGLPLASRTVEND